MSDENMAKAQSNEMMKNYFANTRKVFAGLADQGDEIRLGQGGGARRHVDRDPGHTPGHTSFAVASGNARVLLQQDVTNIPELFLRNPDWHVAYDIDPDKAAQTATSSTTWRWPRRRPCRLHFAFPSIGHVEKDGAGYRLVPIAWNPAI